MNHKVGGISWEVRFVMGVEDRVIEELSEFDLGAGKRDGLCAVVVFSVFIFLGGCGYFYCLYRIVQFTNRSTAPVDNANRQSMPAAEAAVAPRNSEAESSGQADDHMQPRPRISNLARCSSLC